MASVDDLLARARSRYRRVEPADAAAELDTALLIDVRPRELREARGDIPGAIPIGLNVLEWRADPSSEWCIPQIDGHDQRIILICQEGYSSSLAVSRLLDLGLSRATDVTGGFDAWIDAGLPTVPFDRRASPDRIVEQADEPAHPGS